MLSPRMLLRVSVGLWILLCLAPALVSRLGSFRLLQLRVLRTLGSTSGGPAVVNLSAATAVEINGAASTELTSGALAPVTVLKLMQAVDPAYHNPEPDGSGGCAWYMNLAT